MESSESSMSLHSAAGDNFVHLLRYATKKQTNLPDDHGLTPVHHAAKNGHIESLRLLIGRGGNADLPDTSGNTALHLAVTNGHIDAVAFLVNFGVNLWALTNDRKTARDLALNCNVILQMLDSEMCLRETLHPCRVKKLKEKSTVQLEKRLKVIDKVNKCHPKCHNNNNDEGDSESSSSTTKSSSAFNSLSRRTIDTIELKVESLLCRSSRCASFTPSSMSSIATDTSSVTRKLCHRLFHSAKWSHSRGDTHCDTSSIMSKTSKNNNKNRHWYTIRRRDDEWIYSDEDKVVVGQRYRQQFTPLHHRSMGSLSSSDRGEKGCEQEKVISSHTHTDDESSEISRKKCKEENAIRSFSSLTCLTSSSTNDILFAPQGKVHQEKQKQQPANTVDTNNVLSCNVSMAPNSTLRFKASPWLHVFQE